MGVTEAIVDDCLPVDGVLIRVKCRALIRACILANVGTLSMKLALRS